MARASSFNWSELDRQTLSNIMYLAKDRVVDQQVTAAEFHNIITKHVKSYLPIRTRKYQDPLVESSRVYIGGMYYSQYDFDKQKSIELCLAYNPKDRQIKMNLNRFKKFCSNFADTILHEVIHMSQYRKRRFKSLPGYSSTAESTKQRIEQEYLGEDDEIDAYSFNIACELHDKFNGDNRLIIDYLNEDQKGKRRRHNSWRMYLKAFNYDHNHPILRKVKKRVAYYLPKSHSYGRPIHPKDWIKR
jgi:hypothetical protein